jgi:secondary thiamine-phosphate synthase enzyme
MIFQKEIVLPEFKRGFHLITHLIERNLPELTSNGLLNVFIQHTSAALAINENADPSVRYDFNSFINKLIPEGDHLFSHTLEGRDDMPAHLKSSIFGQSINIPITQHRLNLGTWQGIYLCEFRDHGGQRNIVMTVFS